MALVYGLLCGETSDTDVVERRLTVEANGEVVTINSYSPLTTDLGEFTFNQEDNVVLSLVDVDDAGNVSEPAVLSFVAKDTLPPQAPGGFSVALLREVEDSPATTVAPEENVSPETTAPPAV